MNTSNTPTAAIRTLLISLITVGIFSGTAAIADQVGFSTRTETISFKDLDLSTIQGQQIARGRVQKMARTLCGQVADPTDMSHQTNYIACIDATVANAGSSLQALIKKQSNTQFARADVK
jgi:UrcA family protein